MKYCAICKCEVPEDKYIAGLCEPHYEQITENAVEIKNELKQEIEV